MIINAATDEKDNFKDEILERDAQGNILIAPFITKIAQLGFNAIKGCALSVYSHEEANYIYIGLEGKAELIKAQYVNFQHPLQIKYRPVQSAPAQETKQSMPAPQPFNNNSIQP